MTELETVTVTVHLSPISMFSIKDGHYNHSAQFHPMYTDQPFLYADYADCTDCVKTDYLCMV